MDLTVSQSSLHHALRVAARAVPARPVLPVLQHFVLEAGPAGLTVTATDTEVAIVTTAAAELTAPGHGGGAHVAPAAGEPAALTRECVRNPATWQVE